MSDAAGVKGQAKLRLQHDTEAPPYTRSRGRDVVRGLVPRLSSHIAASTATRLLRKLAMLALLLVVACARPGVPLPPVPEPTPTPAVPVSLPRDAGPHDALAEWWYYTGHLRPADGSPGEYGFEFVIFQFVRAGSPPAYMAHFAVTDVAGQRFSHQARFAPASAVAGSLDLDVQGWTLRSEGGRERLEAQMEPGPGAETPFGLRLHLADRKSPALHHGGYIAYGDFGGSYYYSRTRLDAQGSLRLPDGSDVPVSGQAWMDHQWGNFVLAAGFGWDWFSLQLDDQTELMLYVLRDPRGGVSSVFGSEVASDGRVTDLDAGSVKIDALDHWTSPHTGARYPSLWLIELPDRGLRWRVEPKVSDQELYFPGLPEGVALPVYWEGAVRVQPDVPGAPGGVGYVELTEYVSRLSSAAGSAR